MPNDACDLCGRASVELREGICDPCRERYYPNKRPLTRDTLVIALSRHIGAGAGVTISQLVDEVLWPVGVPAAERATIERQARELIVQLRLDGHHVCAHPSRGYFLAESPDELDQTCEFLYSRAMTSLKQVAAMKRVSLPDLRGQLHLPT